MLLAFRDDSGSLDRGDRRHVVTNGVVNSASPGIAVEAQGPTPVGPAVVDIASGTHFRRCLPTYYLVLKTG